MENPITRRRLLSQTGIVVALPLVAQAAEAPAAHALKVLIIGAHPGDPEAGCGGAMARYADQGHEVVAIYLTRGEGGVAGKSTREAAEIRSAEAQAACQILKARPVFAGQIDGATEVTPARYAEFAKLIAGEKPNVVFTHWPVDHHAAPGLRLVDVRRMVALRPHFRPVLLRGGPRQRYAVLPAHGLR